VSKNQPKNEWKIVASQNLFCRLWRPGEHKVSRAWKFGWFLVCFCWRENSLCLLKRGW
jgi:hypothetical protein